MVTIRARRRRRLRFILLVLANVVIGLGLLELSLRLLRPRHPGLRALLHKSTLQTDYGRVDTLPELLDSSTIGYRPLEEVNGYVLNSRGLRTAEYDERKKPGTFRVLALGDSFTFGGVPTADHWTSVLETKIAACRDEPVEVLRMGIPSTGPPFQLRLWQIEGARLDADLVVLGFFVGNDFFDEQGRLPGWRGWVDQLSTVSYAMLAVRNLTRLSGYRPPASRVDADGSPPHRYETGGFEVDDYRDRFRSWAPPFTRRRFKRIEAERMSLCLKEEQWKLGFRCDRVVRFLQQMHTEVTATGARFVLLVIPDEYQVDDGLMQAVAEFAGRSPDEYDILAPQRRITAFASEHGIECLDLLPVFRREVAHRRLYLRRDTHWNRAGNRLAAQELAALLCERAP